jgi:Txe/YoeB family toxin of Txe-Axe toxin-antitoxin module
VYQNAALKHESHELILLIQTPSAHEKLVGDLAGAYSRRITIQYRIVYMDLLRSHIWMVKVKNLTLFSEEFYSD